MEFIKPEVSAADIFEGATPRSETPVGEYSNMRLQSLTAALSKTGNIKLQAFLVHTEATGYKGITFEAPITGTNKNGQSNGKNLAQFLYETGVSKDDAANAEFAVDGNLSAEDWTAKPLVIKINNDIANIAGDEGLIAGKVVVTSVLRGGKSKNVADRVYRAKAA